MAEVRPVTVFILDKEFRVACPEDERAALAESARYLDRKMREIRDSGKVVGADRIAVMAALNIAHELLQQQGQRDEYAHSMQARVRLLQDKIEETLNKTRSMEL